MARKQVESLTDDDILEFFNLCEWMESQNNVGFWPNHDSPSKFMRHEYMKLRAGILYYSEYGWRVRKNPHWRDVFKERFNFPPEE